MYLSRIALNLSKRKTLMALANPNLFHGAIEHAFSGPRTRHLWRIDTLHGQRYLLLVSETQPDFTAIVAQFGYDNHPDTALTKDYTPLLDRIEINSKWHFRLVANPTYAKWQKKDGKIIRGKVYPHVSPKHQRRWLIEQSAKHGFDLTDEDFQIVEDRTFSFKKGPNHKYHVSIVAVTYEGILTVTDTEMFRHALIEGIGREKAYGLGMITVTGPLNASIIEGPC